MSFLLALIQRYGHVALFLFFELIAFFLIINFNHRQRDIFLHSSSLFSGSILQRTTKLNDYLALEDSNQDLLDENARLLKEIINIPRPKLGEADTTVISYNVVPAKVLTNSISSVRNTFTIDKGERDGIKPHMGVITADGVAGIVKQVSKNYAVVLSLINVDIHVSSSLEGEDFFGNVSWDGQAYNRLSLQGLPVHAPAGLGNTIVTNGYSTIFPKDIAVGDITTIEVDKTGALFNIEVKPKVDFSNLGFVYVLLGEDKEEITQLLSDE